MLPDTTNSIQSQYSIQLFNITYHLNVTKLEKSFVLWLGTAPGGVMGTMPTPGSNTSGGGGGGAQLNFFVNALTMPNPDKINQDDDVPARIPISSTIYTSTRDHVNVANEDIKNLAQIITKRINKPVSLLTSFDTIDTMDLLPLQDAIVKILSNL